MRNKQTTITVQFDVEYDSGYVEVGDISADLSKRLARIQEERPYRRPTGEAGWWTTAVRTFDYATEPIGFPQLSASFDRIGEVMDAYDDGEMTAEELHEAIREQVGERPSPDQDAAAKLDFEAYKERVIAANPPPKFITIYE